MVASSQVVAWWCQFYSVLFGFLIFFIFCVCVIAVFVFLCLTSNGSAAMALPGGRKVAVHVLLSVFSVFVIVFFM